MLLHDFVYYTLMFSHGCYLGVALNITISVEIVHVSQPFSTIGKNCLLKLCRRPEQKIPFHRGGSMNSLQGLEKNATATPKMAMLLTTLEFSGEVKV